jgi:Zn-dependent membrane protease YugP
MKELILIMLIPTIMMLGGLFIMISGQLMVGTVFFAIAVFFMLRAISLHLNKKS